MGKFSPGQELFLRAQYIHGARDGKVRVATGKEAGSLLFDVDEASAIPTDVFVTWRTLRLRLLRFGDPTRDEKAIKEFTKLAAEFRAAEKALEKIGDDILRARGIDPSKVAT